MCSQPDAGQLQGVGRLAGAARIPPDEASGLVFDESLRWVLRAEVVVGHLFWYRQHLGCEVVSLHEVVHQAASTDSHVFHHQRLPCDEKQEEQEGLSRRLEVVVAVDSLVEEVWGVWGPEGTSGVQVQH